MRHELHTEIDIDATPETVWAVLSDLDAYPEWNPFIVSAQGTLEAGRRLVNRLQPPGGKAMTFKPTVTVVDPGSCLEWLGRLVMPGIFDGRHRFEIHRRADGGSRLVHSEQFRGLLVRVMRSSLDRSTRAGFDAMNEALRTRAETARTLEVSC